MNEINRHRRHRRRYPSDRNKIIEYTLTNAGYNVVNVGVLSSREDFINAAIETDCKNDFGLPLLYRHGEIDCRRMREKCIESGIRDIILYAGGNTSSENGF